MGNRERLIKRVVDLYEKMRKEGVDMDDAINFITLRNAAIPIYPRNDTLFMIWEAIIARAAGEHKSWTPATVINLRYENKERPKVKEQLELLTTITEEKYPSVLGAVLDHNMNVLLPAKNIGDLMFGIEALYSLVYVGEDMGKPAGPATPPPTN